MARRRLQRNKFLVFGSFGNEPQPFRVVGRTRGRNLTTIPALYTWKLFSTTKIKKKIVRKWRLYGWGIVGSRCPAAVIVFHSRREGKVCVQTTGFYYWNLEKKNKRGLPSSVYTAAKCKAVLASNARCCWLGAEVKSRSAMSCSLFQPTRTIASMAVFLSFFYFQSV